MCKSCFTIEKRDAWHTSGGGTHLNERFMIICLNILHLSVNHLHICFHSATALRWLRPTSRLYLNTGCHRCGTQRCVLRRENISHIKIWIASKWRSNLLPARHEGRPFEPQITCKEEKVPCWIVFTHLYVPFSSPSSVGLMAGGICAGASDSCLWLKRLRLCLQR